MERGWKGGGALGALAGKGRSRVEGCGGGGAREVRIEPLGRRGPRTRFGK